MRVLFPYPQAYGYFPDIYEYVTALRRRGVDARYVGIQGDADGNLPAHTAHLPAGEAGRERFTEFVSDQIAAIEPDIVHVFHFRGCGVLPVRARSADRKWIADVRTIHVETRDYRIRSGFWLRDRLTWLETQTYDYVLALTERIRSNLRPSLRPVRIVPLGASATTLNPPDKEAQRANVRAAWNLPADAPVLLYAGSLSPSRQIDKVIRGFALLHAQRPDARLLIVGGEAGRTAADDPFIQPLRQMAADLGAGAHVTFCGRVPYWDMPGYFAAADIGVSFMPLGTPHQFQPPTKLVETMMAGLVPASNRIPAIEGLIADNVDGILFGDTEAEIAAGLGRAVALLDRENRAAREHLIARAVAAVRERDWQYIVDTQLVPLYEQLCAK